MDKKKKSLRIRLREILDEKGITIQQLAEKAGLHYNTALALVNDKYKRIGLDTLAAISIALDVEPGELLEWEK